MKTQNLKKLILKKEIVVLLNDAQQNINGGATTNITKFTAEFSNCKYCSKAIDTLQPALPVGR